MRRRGALLLLLLGLLAPALLAGAGDEDERALSFLAFDRYRDVRGIADALDRIHRAWPERTRLASMGKSREGRDLLVMTVFDATGGDPDQKPIMYIDGNTHGNEVQASEVCLFTIKYLLTRDDPFVAGLLRRVTFVVAPTVNPDARDRFFHAPATPHGPRGVMRPVDDDRDGAFDEDGPDDLDGDGEILRMRVKDVNGEFVVDERDDRLMRRKKPGEQGQYRLLGLEGRDDDGDGAFNEDPPGGVDPNRNWPSQWRPEEHQHGAGPFPLSEPETRATALFLLSLPHLSGVQSYHNAGRMILRPPAAWTDREIRMPGEDKALYDEIGRRGLFVLPTYRTLQIREDLYRVYGGFVDWTYLDLGAFSFTNELWGEIGKGVPGAGDDPRLAALEWNDVALHGEGFVRWHEVEHPDLGTVELGGWRRFTIRADPPDFLPETCVRNCLFTLEHAAMLPRISVGEVTPLDGGGLRVVLRNDGVLPTIHALARRRNSLPPDRLTVEGAKVLAAIEEHPRGPASVLEVRDGGVRLPGGIDGKATRTLVLFVEGAAQGVVLESRVGGVVRRSARGR